jgi:hypothetical protein
MIAHFGPSFSSLSSASSPPAAAAGVASRFTRRVRRAGDAAVLLVVLIAVVTVVAEAAVVATGDISCSSMSSSLHVTYTSRDVTTHYVAILLFGWRSVDLDHRLRARVARRRRTAHALL